MRRNGRKKEAKRVNVGMLKMLLKEKGIVNLKDLSRAMGYHEDYLNQLLRQGELSKFAITYIKNFYGISYTDYKYINEPEVVAEPIEDTAETVTENQSTEDENVNIGTACVEQETIVREFDLSDNTINKLADAMYKAVYSAVIAAWKDM